MEITLHANRVASMILRDITQQFFPKTTTFVSYCLVEGLFLKILSPQ